MHRLSYPGVTRKILSSKIVLKYSFFWKLNTKYACRILFRSSFEGFFASKGAAYALPDGDFARRATKHGGKESKG